MAFTLKTKLFAGFGALIGVSVVSGLVIIKEAHIVQDRSDFVLEESVPTMLSVSELRGSIHHALSMHRGYMILGLDELADERLKAWESINAAMVELSSISTDWQEDQKRLVGELETVLIEFRDAQDQIAAISNTVDDRPANKLFFEQALPESERVVAALDAILAEERSLETTPERKMLVERVGEAKGHLLRASSAVAAFLVTGTASDEEYVRACISECSTSVERLQADAGLFSSSQRNNFETYLAHRSKFLDLSGEAIRIRKSDQWCISQDLCLNQVTPLAGEADSIASEIVRLQTDLHATAGADAKEQLSTAVGWLPKIVIIASLVSAIFGGFVAVLMSRSVNTSIRAIAGSAKSIASRDLSIKPLEVKTKDDLGQLAESVNEMLASLREIVSEVDASSMEVAGASEQILSSSTQVADGMDQQMREVEQISAAVSEMSASVNEVAESSRQASGPQASPLGLQKAAVRLFPMLSLE